MKKGLFILLFVIAFVGAGFAVKAEAVSVVNCNFTRDLSIGSWGEDVRCLQSYLANAGYGAMPADGYYGPMTAQIVARWQAGYGIAPSGYFDAQSRARYAQLVGNTNVYNPTSTQESKALQVIKDALMMIVAADEAIDDSRRNTSKAKDLLGDAKTDMQNAVKAFMAGNFSKAINLASDAYDNAEEARNRANTGSGNNSNDKDRDDVEDLIDDVDERIEDAEDEIDDARNRGVNVNEAEDLIDEARDTLDDAEDEFDDGDYDDAEELAEEADELVDDALDEIDSDNGGDNDRDDALNAIDDAQDAIDDAWDEVEEADDDGEDVDDAEELLEDAEDKLDDAQIEFNKGDYDEAQDLAEEAEELADDALDEIN